MKEKGEGVLIFYPLHSKLSPSVSLSVKQVANGKLRHCKRLRMRRKQLRQHDMEI